MEDQTTVQEDTMTPIITAGAAATRAQVRGPGAAEALMALRELDNFGMEPHEVLGILCATAPAAVIAAVHAVVAGRAAS